MVNYHELVCTEGAEIINPAIGPAYRNFSFYCITKTEVQIVTAGARSIAATTKDLADKRFISTISVNVCTNGDARANRVTRGCKALRSHVVGIADKFDI